MHNWESMADVRWKCKYHVVFICSSDAYTFPIEIFGDKGTVRDNRVWSYKFPGQKDWVKVPTILPDTAEVAHHPFQAQMDHFVECLLSDKKSHCNLKDAILTHEVVFAAQECYRTGCPVKLPLLAP